MSFEARATHEGLLALVFQNRVTITELNEHQLEGNAIRVCDVEYRDNSSSLAKQTVVVVESQALELPEFSLRSKGGFAMQTIQRLMGNIGEIEFSDSPAFSQHYCLNGWNASVLRQLFSRSLRDYLGELPGWNLRSQLKCLFLFQSNQVVPTDEREQWIDTALDIALHIEQAQQQLPPSSELRRTTTATDIANQASQMTGPIGGMIARQLAKMSVSRNVLERFLASPTPRQVPRAIDRQVMHDNFMLIPMGILFIVVGDVGGIIMILSDGNKNMFLAITLMTFFTLIGGAMTGITSWYRQRKLKVLQLGQLLTARITSVQPTELVINDQMQYRVDFECTSSTFASSLQLNCNAYALAADEAQRRLSSGEPVRILVDPSDSKNFVCVDLLNIVEP